MRASQGFTLLETLFVVVIIGLIAAMVVPITDRMIRTGKADSSVIAALDAIDTARDRAVAERRNFVLNFVGNNQIQLLRQEIDAAGNVTGTTTTNTFLLENGLQFVKFTGMPDTPDAFGNATVQSFTGTAPVMFTSDGSLIDSNGDVVNGTILLGIPNQASSARAVTIFGVTGLTRTWNWRESAWKE